MYYLGLLFTLALLAANLWGLMLVAGLYWRNRWLALAAGPILGVTGIYAIECQGGLGPSLAGLCLLSTAVSAAMIALSFPGWEPSFLRGRAASLIREWRSEFAPRGLLGCFGVFGAIFLYAMLWRNMAPKTRTTRAPWQLGPPRRNREAARPRQKEPARRAIATDTAIKRRQTPASDEPDRPGILLHISL